MIFAASATAAAEPTDPNIYEERRRRNWCGPTHERDALPGLDDANCAKRFPPMFDVDFHCPSEWPASKLEGFGAPPARVEDAAVADELARIVPAGTGVEAKATVGVIRREQTGGAPSVRWLGNGAARDAHQPWSSSKVLAAAHAAARLRTLRRDVGLDATERGTALGDLMTIVAAYDVNASRPGVSSNALGAYFHALGGHSRADEYLHRELGASRDESFGGDYGAPVPASVGYMLTPPSDAGSPPLDVRADPPPQPPISNQMSCLSMAEWLRRIVCVREDRRPQHSERGRPSSSSSPPTNASAPLVWADSVAMLYGNAGAHSSGADGAGLFPGLQWGGLSMGTDVYVQSAVDLNAMSTRSRGLWRIFSKLGAGVSSTAHPGRFEITLNAYGCFPVVESDVEGRGGGAARAVPARGLEFVLSAAVVSDVAGDDGKSADEAMRALVANVTALLLARYDGRAG